MNEFITLLATERLTWFDCKGKLRLSDFRVKKKILHGIDSRIYTPKNSNYLRSHFRAIMALDHSRLGLENEFLENKSGRIFCVRQVYLTKSCQQL